MTEENQAETQEQAEPKAKKTRRPSYKDWIRVMNSAGSSLPNTTVKLIYNEANGICRLVTQAPRKEGSDELEEPRTQVFKITEFETINDADDDPVAEAERIKAERAERRREKKAAKEAEKTAKESEGGEEAKAEIEDPVAQETGEPNLVQEG